MGKIEHGQIGYRQIGCGQDRTGGTLTSAKAQLLLARPCTFDREQMAARLLGVLSTDQGSLQRVRTGRRGTLVLRSRRGFVGLSLQNRPLGAARFHGAILPFTPASERGELMRLIEHHEAHVSLRLSLTGREKVPVARLLRRALAAIAAESGAIGLLWQPTGRLHGQGALAGLLSGREEAQLLVAPRPAAIGPRRLPALDFVAARGVLGYRVRLHLLDITYEAASAAGFAFVAAALAEPGLRAHQSFTHDGQAFRIAHDGASRDIALLPVARIAPLARAA